MNRPARSIHVPEGDSLADGLVEVLKPKGDQIGPIVYASPHSGQVYGPDFIRASRLDPLTLRRSEDFRVDDLFASCLDHGAPLLRAHFPRAFLDPNREAFELDPMMFDGPLPGYCNTRSPRVAGGLGTIARVVADGHEIYAKRLSFAEAEARIDRLYRPYHAALSDLLAAAKARHGAALLVDCHSMPSIGGPMDQDKGHSRSDFILGDRHGTSCAPWIVEAIQSMLAAQGHKVTRNEPYAGGYCTAHYGRPKTGVHAVQIEVNRALYMDEARMEASAGFDAIRALLADMVAGLAQEFGDHLGAA
jgi:N-formylglutamate amidohydrolase